MTSPVDLLSIQSPLEIQIKASQDQLREDADRDIQCLVVDLLVERLGNEMRKAAGITAPPLDQKWLHTLDEWPE